MAGYTEKTMDFILRLEDTPLRKALVKVAQQWEGVEKSVDKAKQKIDSVGESLRDAEKTSKKSIEPISKEMDSLAKSVKNVEDQTNQSTSAMIGAMGILQGGFHGVKDAADQVGAGQQTESLLSTMLNLNKILNISRAELRQLRREIVQIPPGLFGLVGVDEIRESLEGLVHAGARSKEVLTSLTIPVALVAKATGESFDEVAKDFFRWNRQFGLSIESVINLQASIHNLARTTGATFQEMRGSLGELMDEFEVGLRGLSENVRTQTIASFAGMRGVFADEWADIAPVVQNLAKAMANPMSEEAQRMAAASGMAIDDLVANLRGGRIDVVMREIMSRASQYADSGVLSLQGWSETTGIASHSLSIMARRQGAINQRLADYRTSLNRATNGTEQFSDAIRNSTTWGQRLMTGISSLAARDLPGLGFSLMDVKERLFEINWLNLWAGITVVKSLWSSISGVVVSLAKTGGILGWISKGILLLGAGIKWVVGVLLGIKAAIVIVILALTVGVAWLLKATGHLQEVWELLKSTAKDVAEPIVNAFKNAWDYIKPLFKDTGALGEAIRATADYARYLWTQIKGFVNELLGMDLQKWGDKVSVVVKGIITYLGMGLKGLSVVLSWAIAILTPFVKVWIWLNKIALKTLFYIGYGIFLILKVLWGVIKVLWTIAKAVAWVIGLFIDLISFAFRTITTVASLFLEVTGIGGAFMSVVSAVWTGIKAIGGFFAWLAVGIYKIFATIGSFLIEYLVTKPLEAITSGWDSLMGYIASASSAISETLKNALISVLEFLGLSNAGSIVSGIWKAMFDLLTAPIDTLKGWINSYVVDTINEVFGYEFPLIGSLTSKRIPRLAQGGIVEAPTLVLAGERGQELIIPESRVLSGTGNTPTPTPLPDNFFVQPVTQPPIVSGVTTTPSIREASERIVNVSINMGGVEDRLDVLILLAREFKDVISASPIGRRDTRGQRVENLLSFEGNG